MLRFTPKDPDLARFFLAHTLRYYMQPLRARDVPEFVEEMKSRLGLEGLSRTGEGKPAGYIGTQDDPEMHPIYWNR
ncbi:hypothetical protein C8N35_102414 [Breoghania corrubedonensis]|uniref:Uncharacterized protein n=1 Tax=Breoghania corrubedonensis TaxID=665038 RepID=A0A2T5VD66_9HYPH|nr:hypothetical protein [Breoghania corrubedonensis]PTW61698.1 hypothetical protein C8N35_102414 [Breoghania corrubedonensis]